MTTLKLGSVFDMMPQLTHISINSFTTSLLAGNQKSLEGSQDKIWEKPRWKFEKESKTKILERNQNIILERKPKMLGGNQKL